MRAHQSKKWILAATLSGLLWPMIRVSGQTDERTPEVLLERAIQTEMVDGDLKAAIEQYKEIIARAGSNRAVAARALVRLGACYERQGNAESRKAYEQVVRDYTDQRDMVAQARARLAALGQSSGAASPSVVRRVVWSGLGVDSRYGKPSPDGTLLPYVDWETGDLAIRDLSIGKNRRLTNKGSWRDSLEFALFSTMSPDAKQVAYTWWKPGRFFDLRLVGLDGSAPRVLYSNKEMTPGYVDWSSDGTQILTSLHKGDATSQIALISVATGSVRILKSLDWQAPSTMALSPDGRFVLYDVPAQPDSRQRDIYLLSTDATKNLPLVAGPADERALGWVDAQHVLFASGQNAATGAYLQRVKDGRADGAPQLVKPDLGRILPGGSTRNGSYYYTVVTGGPEIFTATLDPVTGRVLTAPRSITHETRGSRPDWSPDGRYVAYFSTPDRELPGSSLVLSIRSVETGDVRDLYPPLKSGLDNLAGDDLRWFPDGRALLVRASDLKNRVGFFRIDSQTGAVSVVWSAPDPLSPSFSPDGKTLFFARGQGDPTWTRPQVLALDLERRTERVVHSGRTGDSDPSYWMCLSPDGQLLAFWSNLATLSVVPTSGGEPRVLHRVAEPGSVSIAGGLAWSPDGRYLLFTTRPATGADGLLWRIPVSGGEPQKLDIVIRDADTGAFSLRMHPDGRRVAFSAGSEKFELWAMDNLLAVTRSQRSAARAR